MKSVLIFSPSWLESTFTKQTKKNNVLKKNIFLEIQEKPKKIFKNLLSLDNLTLRPEIKFNNTIPKNNINFEKKKAEKLKKYYALDDRKYYFTMKDFDNYLKYDNFDIELCRINSPYFKNNHPKELIKNKYMEETLLENIEYYYSCINHVDNTGYQWEDYESNLEYHNSECNSESESDIDEFETF